MALLDEILLLLPGLVILTLIVILLLTLRRRAKGNLVLKINRNNTGGLYRTKPNKFGLLRLKGGAYPVRPEHTIRLGDQGGIKGDLIILRSDVPAPLVLEPPDDRAPVLEVQGIFAKFSPGREFYLNPEFPGNPVAADGEVETIEVPTIQARPWLTPDWKSAYEVESLVNEMKLKEWYESGGGKMDNFYFYVTWGVVIGAAVLIGVFF